jgi:hypothetical protein
MNSRICWAQSDYGVSVLLMIYKISKLNKVAKCHLVCLVGFVLCTDGMQQKTRIRPEYMPALDTWMEPVFFILLNTLYEQDC